MTDWTAEDAAEIYGIRRWGNGYFDVTPDGALAVRLPEQGARPVPLPDILAGLRERGLSLPLLLRVENLLDNQIARLHRAFRDAMTEQTFPGRYRGVYPIKVNQQRQVVEEIVRFGTPWGHGLEAGSKAELAIAVASLPLDGRLLICNGYKDRQFIELGLQARALGHDCIFVLETPAELDLILECSERLGIEPALGIRAKLATRVGGHWNLTSGERSIFGLSITQMVQTVDRLRGLGRLSWLRLLHCHLGSQIPELEQVAAAAREASRFYAELVREGAPLGLIDFGGGLAVDYLGQRSTDSQSCNYSLRDYASCLVATLKAELDGLPAPDIVTESGRPLVAYYSMLLFNLFDLTRFEPAPGQIQARPDDQPKLRELTERVDRLSESENPEGDYRRVLQLRDELHRDFVAGDIDLRRRARVQNLVLAAGRTLLERFGSADNLPESLQELRDELADIAYGNLSVFQSLPDHWAIGQLFPVAPIARLNERPAREAIIADITCDSDGRISRFVGLEGERTTLPVHGVAPGEDYVMGVFLVGAYQETLGDLHNLFGDTDIASVRIDKDGCFEVIREDKGDSVAGILAQVQYSSSALRDRLRATAEEAVRSDRISLEQRRAILSCFDACLRSGTYHGD